MLKCPSLLLDSIWHFPSFTRTDVNHWQVRTDSHDSPDRPAVLRSCVSHSPEPEVLCLAYFRVAVRKQNEQRTFSHRCSDKTSERVKEEKQIKGLRLEVWAWLFKSRKALCCSPCPSPKSCWNIKLLPWFRVREATSCWDWVYFLLSEPLFVILAAKNNWVLCECLGISTQLMQIPGYVRHNLWFCFFDPVGKYIHFTLNTIRCAGCEILRCNLRGSRFLSVFKVDILLVIHEFC